MGDGSQISMYYRPTSGIVAPICVRQNELAQAVTDLKFNNACGGSIAADEGTSKSF